MHLANVQQYIFTNPLTNVAAVTDLKTKQNSDTTHALSGSVSESPNNTPSLSRFVRTSSYIIRTSSSLVCESPNTTPELGSSSVKCPPPHLKVTMRNLPPTLHAVVTIIIVTHNRLQCRHSSAVRRNARKASNTCIMVTMIMIIITILMIISLKMVIMMIITMIMIMMMIKMMMMMIKTMTKTMNTMIMIMMMITKMLIISRIKMMMMTTTKKIITIILGTKLNPKTLRTTIVNVTVITKMTTVACQVRTTKNAGMMMTAHTNKEAKYIMNTLLSSPKKNKKVVIILADMTR